MSVRPSVRPSVRITLSKYPNIREVVCLVLPIKEMYWTSVLAHQLRHDLQTNNTSTVQVY